MRTGCPVPKYICTNCLTHLNKWQKTGSTMPFGIPMMGMNRQGHIPAECYGCINTVRGTNRKKVGGLRYTETTYVELPKPHSDQIPILKRTSPTEEYMPPSFESMQTDETPVSIYQP